MGNIARNYVKFCMKQNEAGLRYIRFLFIKFIFSCFILFHIKFVSLTPECTLQSYIK